MYFTSYKISFTFILPLYPKLLEFYRHLDSSPSSSSSSSSQSPPTTTTPPTLLTTVFSLLNTYKHSFSRPISSRYDIVLLGGALGSLFSLLQAIASPIIGTLSDRYGRRTALLGSMAGNIASVALWVAATDFRTFLASRVVGGLSEGNVQLAVAMAADVSDEVGRGRAMALVGACFSVAFTVGPMLGAWLASVDTGILGGNPFATAAGFSLLLIVTETVYLYLYLPETRPAGQRDASSATNGGAAATEKTKKDDNDNNEKKKQKPAAAPALTRTNTHLLLNSTHLLFILFFSGIEFSLPFMTYDLFAYPSRRTGLLLGFMGLIASALQATLTRRLHPLRVVQIGVVACTVAFVLLGRVQTEAGLWGASALLAVTTATVVTGLNALSSFEAGEGERGGKLGNHRSWGELRLCCPILAGRLHHGGSWLTFRVCVL